ncbi:MAG: hypothetical protein WC525_07965 [Candidatus Thermoplasmatota archaeon]
MKKRIALSLIGMVLLSGVGAGAIIPRSAWIENHRPDAPTITGPTSVKVGIGYTWSFNSTDPDGDNLTYYVDWGDVCGGAEWHGPYPSGVAIEMDHTYLVKNILIINSMAVDENGAESNMTYFEVAITTSVSLGCMFMRLLQRFPHLFSVLRCFIEE